MSSTITLTSLCEKLQKQTCSKHHSWVFQATNEPTWQIYSSRVGNRSSTKGEVAGMLGVNRLCRTRRHETTWPSFVNINKSTNSFTESMQSTTQVYADFAPRSHSHNRLTLTRFPRHRGKKRETFNRRLVIRHFEPKRHLT